ncbi:unnamed protein product [Rotaria magnacalcarata]|uniref:F-box domain-containing protein n=2 Tax=Rotaria magnacalcarata TaxID=392030 RepID=A0A815RAP5_9BILA|nr:unnamed protein product [Rotaria magnacalcarata]CAF1472692.1 unnamed protein product [Rotaria magnacalcarata]
MQRAIPQQKIGVYFLYSVPHRFHYIKLVEDFPSSLAQRAGIKSYDRVIFVNGVNIENDTSNQLDHRFDTERHLPFEMLVCSPATYEYTIKLTKMGNSHTDIPVISFDNKSFCAVRWENSNMISAVPQSAIFKSPEFTMLNDICVIEVDGQYRKGQIIFKGSQSDCEKWNTSSISSLINDGSSTMDNALIRKTFGMHSGSTSDETMILLSSSMSLQNLESNTTISNVNEKNKVRHTTDASQRIPKSIPTTLEELPNELLYYLFTFLDIQHLHKAFWGLNSRLNNIFQSCKTLSLIFNEEIDPLLIEPYAPYCHSFNNSNIQTLQIQPNSISKLTHLTFMLGSKYTLSSKLTRKIFSNEFPSLHYVNLGRIYEPGCNSWCTSPSLHFVSILSCELMCIPYILVACPNLHHLQVHVSLKNNKNMTASLPFNHPLRRLTLWSYDIELNFDAIDKILTYTPNVECLYLQTIYHTSFMNLAHGIIHRLPNLLQFQCYVKEILSKNDRNNDLTTLHQFHPCFNRIQSIEKEDDY